MLLAGKIKYKYVCLTAYKQKNAEGVKRTGISEQEKFFTTQNLTTSRLNLQSTNYVEYLLVDLNQENRNTYSVCYAFPRLHFA